MFKAIQPLDIYNKNVSILIGSGASAQLFPTLALKIRSRAGRSHESIETLATAFHDSDDQRTALFMHYYNTCVWPAQQFDPDQLDLPEQRANFEQYGVFLETIIGLLERRKDSNRKINIFTTNYDGCLPFAADELQRSGVRDFVIKETLIN